jgi:hypothetical protein
MVFQAEEIQEQGVTQPQGDEGARADQHRAAWVAAARPQQAASAPENNASGDANDSTAHTITDAIITGMSAAFRMDQVGRQKYSSAISERSPLSSRQFPATLTHRRYGMNAAFQLYQAGALPHLRRLAQAATMCNAAMSTATLPTIQICIR